MFRIFWNCENKIIYIFYIIWLILSSAIINKNCIIFTEYLIMYLIRTCIRIVLKRLHHIVHNLSQQRLPLKIIENEIYHLCVSDASIANIILDDRSQMLLMNYNIVDYNMVILKYRCNVNFRFLKWKLKLPLLQSITLN